MIYMIRVSKRKKESDFEQFMRAQIFPSIDKSSRRDGQVSSLVLLKGNTTGRTNEYVWFVDGTVNGGAANQKLDDITAFGARVTPLQEFVECAKWLAVSEQSSQ